VDVISLLSFRTRFETLSPEGEFARAQNTKKVEQSVRQQLQVETSRLVVNARF
jgi:hypothetical protein